MGIGLSALRINFTGPTEAGADIVRIIGSDVAEIDVDATFESAITAPHKSARATSITKAMFSFIKTKWSAVFKYFCQNLSKEE
jgi:hypothetical protein